MFKDSVEKRIRRNETLPHPEMDVMWSGMWRWLLQLHVPFYIFLAFYQDYIPFLATMDAAIVLLMVVFHLTFRQLIQRGAIKAFYRQHYANSSGMFWSFILIGSFIRTILFGLYYGFSLGWSAGDVTKERFNHYLSDLQHNLSSVTGVLLGVVLCLYLFYSLFYKERLITVVDYSERVVRSMRQQGLAFNQAAQSVLNQRKRELDSSVSQTVKNENNNGDMFGQFFGNKDVNSNGQQAERKAERKPEPEYAPMRRQARKN